MFYTDPDLDPLVARAALLLAALLGHAGQGALRRAGERGWDALEALAGRRPVGHRARPKRRRRRAQLPRSATRRAARPPHHLAPPY